MRVLALDYGSARCGCAVCDPSGTIVTPIAAVERPASKRGVVEIVRLVAEREVGCVLIGLPLSLRGEDTAQTRETREFAARLSARLGDGVVVELYDERFTTRIAAGMIDGNSSEDSRAAAVLLEDWLARSACSERTEGVSGQAP
jgi:putative holliday junction resolvase